MYYEYWKKIIKSKNRMLSTVAWKLNNEVTYALEGSVFIAGALVQWLRDKLSIIRMLLKLKI